MQRGDIYENKTYFNWVQNRKTLQVSKSIYSKWISSDNPTALCLIIFSAITLDKFQNVLKTL